MIDWERIDELRTEIGEDDFGEVVEIFLEEVEEGLEELKSTQHGSSLAKTLHFLKGSALNLGFQSFSSLCQAGETSATEGNEGDVDLAKLFACYRESKKAFERGLSG